MPPRDMRLESALGRVLTAGTAIAALVTLAGLTLHLLHRHAELPDYTRFDPNAETLTGVGRTLSAAARLDPEAIMQLGVLLLILTPVARVLFTLIAFAARRDTLYIVVTALVLAALLYGLAGGRV